MNPENAENNLNPYEPIKADVVEKWLGSLDVSESTQRQYRRCMRYFCAYVRACGLDFDDMEAAHVQGYKKHLLNEKKLSPATTSLYLSGIRSYYRFAEDQGLTNIARNVRGEASSRDFKKDSLSPEQARKVLDSIIRVTLIGKRDYAMINLMLRIGLRDIEVSRACIGDIRSDGDVSMIFVHGKGRSEKSDFLLLDEEALSPIEEYLDERARLRGKLRGHDPLFASESNNNRGGKMSPISISAIVKTALRNAGFDSDRLTAHSLRHSAITFSLQGGATEREAQEMARHSSITTTMLYSHHIDRVANAAEWKVRNVF